MGSSPTRSYKVVTAYEVCFAPGSEIAPVEAGAEQRQRPERVFVQSTIPSAEEHRSHGTPASQPSMTRAA